LRQVVQVVRISQRSGESPREAAERLLDRRRVLKAAGLAAAAGALAPYAKAFEPPAKPQMVKANGEKVVVVGAGIAGLHCAYRLRQAGVDVVVYEAARRIGGRNLTDRKTFGPQHCELGGELIDSSHLTMRSLAGELEIDLLDYYDDDPDLHEMIGFIDGQRLTMEEMFDEFLPIATAMDASWAELTDPDGDVTCLLPNGAEALDRMTIAQWLDQSAAAPASSKARKFLEVAYVAEFGLEADNSSALNMLAMLVGCLDGRLPEDKAWNVFGASDERWHAADGNDHYSHRLADRVGRDRIHLGERLMRARTCADGRVELTFDGERGSSRVCADRAVFALPFTTLRLVDLQGVELSPTKRRAIAELGMGKNAKMMTGYRERVWRTHGVSGILLSDLDLQCAWDTSRLQVGTNGILTHFSGGDRAAKIGDLKLAEHRRLFLDDIEKVYPGTKAAATEQIVRFDWPRYALTKGSYSAYLPGQWTTLRGSEGTAEGPLHFCGEHTSPEFQGFMEGAAESGLRAAREVASALGVRIQEPAPPAVPANS
jgi:monoamine oxidase